MVFEEMDKIFKTLSISVVARGEEVYELSIYGGVFNTRKMEQRDGGAV
jgi:hypothetical protein